MEKTVTQMSTLLWVQLIVLTVAVVGTYFSNMNEIGSKTMAILISGVIAVVILAWIIWTYHNWSNALIQRPMRLTLAQSAKRLNILLVIFLIFAGLGILFNAIGLIGVISMGTLPSLKESITPSLQLIFLIVAFTVAFTARTWIRTGYSTEKRRQRPILIWGLRAYVIVTILQSVNTVVSKLTDPDSSISWPNIVLTAINTALVIWTTVLAIRLIQSTFGVTTQESLENPGMVS